VGKSRVNKFREKEEEFEVTSDDEMFEIILPNVKEKPVKKNTSYIKMLAEKKN